MDRRSTQTLATLSLLFPWLSSCALAPGDAEDPGGPETDEVVQAATLTQVTSFGSNPGNLKMYTYVPAGLPSGAPLVVAMHGCTQNASVYATQTQWDKLADRYQFAVVFPEQQSANNSLSCFSWFQTADYGRGQGEALSIKQMVDTMKSTRGSDPARVFVTGMSAGGFMTTAMMGSYPDVFAAGSVNAGGPYGCATSVSGASTCQNGQVSRTPKQWGDLVRNAFAGYTGPYPRLAAFHGTTDTTVVPADMQQAVDQWSDVLGIDTTPEVNETFRTATHKVYRDAAGRAMIETYLVSGMGHALTVDPGTATDQGGATGAYSEDHDIYSSYYAARFFGLIDGGGGGGDTVPPSASITSPSNGAVVSGALAVSATASDNVGVARVDVLVDGAVAGSDSTAPYSIAIDTTALANGSHTLVARAVDGAGNTGSSTAVTVTVQNDGGGGGGRLETFSSASGPDQPGWTFGGWALSAQDATGTPGSRSLAATAAPAFGTVTRTATWANVVLGAAPTLSYARTLALSDANVLASAGFRIMINDGIDHVIDAKTISGLTSYNEPSFVTRANLDLSAFAGKTVMLKLEVTATDLASTVTRANAVIDQIQIQ